MPQRAAETSEAGGRVKQTKTNSWKQSSKWTGQHPALWKSHHQEKEAHKGTDQPRGTYKLRFRNCTARQFFSLETNGRFWFLFNYTLSLWKHVHTLTLLCLCKCTCVYVSLCVQRPESNTQGLPHSLHLNFWDGVSYRMDLARLAGQQVPGIPCLQTSMHTIPSLIWGCLES